MGKIRIRNEMPADERTVECITREAFWNLNAPGCDEHFFAHTLRTHEDFIKELDFVLEVDGKIAGNIMYTKAMLTDESGGVKQILTFGPLSVHPEHQRKGYGKALIEHSFEKAIELGYDTVVIFGDPTNYVGRGFKSCKKFNVCLAQDVYPCAMLVKELQEGVLKGKKWIYHESPAFQIDPKQASEFDKSFDRKEKESRPSHETFYILSHSVIA